MKTDIVRDDKHFLAILPSDWYGNYILAKSDRKLPLSHFRSELIHDAEDTVEALWLKERRVPMRPMEFVVRRNLQAVDEEGKPLLDDDGKYVGDNDSFGYKIELQDAPSDHPWHQRWPIVMVEAKAKIAEARRLAALEEGFIAADWDDNESVTWCTEHAAFRAMTADDRVWDDVQPHKCETAHESVLRNVSIPAGRHLEDQIRRAKEDK